MEGGESVTDGTLWDARRPRGYTQPYQPWWLCMVDLIFPKSRGIGFEFTIEKLEFKESSVVEVCSKDCTEGFSQWQLV